MKRFWFLDWRVLQCAVLTTVVACGGGSGTRSEQATASPAPLEDGTGAEGASGGSEPASSAEAASAEVQAIPEGFRTLTPHLVVADVRGAIDYYERAFGAERHSVMEGPDGEPVHAEIRIGDSIVMLSPEREERDTQSPKSLGGTCGSLYVYVEDVDATFEKAIEEGGEREMPVTDMFWGDRYGQLTDPFGHRWSLATHKLALSDEEIAERAEKWTRAMAQGETPPAFEGGEPAASFKPKGYATVTPSLIVDGPEQLEFYRKAFGGKVREEMATPEGKLMHAELGIGDSILMMSDEFPKEHEYMQTAAHLGAAPVSLYVYVPDVDETFAQALEHGAEEQKPVTEMFWGDRYGQVSDPSGHHWGLATRVADLTPEQIRERMREQGKHEGEGEHEGQHEDEDEHANADE